jgi:hypothetical protein
MKKGSRTLAAGLCFAVISLTASAQSAMPQGFDPVTAMEQAQTLTGDPKLACEALLCLAAANRPAECRPSIRKLFSIWRPSKRIRFLRLCPSTDGNPGMAQFAQVTADAWPTCTASWLNENHVYYAGDDGPFVYSTLPGACAAYNQHAWTMPQAMPRYVGRPEEGGRWVDQ